MKKILCYLSVMVFCLAATQALAFPIKTGRNVVSYRSGMPATITVKETGESYDAFCMQYDVKISDGETYNVGSVGSLPLADNSKWLYAAYYEGVFDTMDYSALSAENSDHDIDLGMLVQYGIWYSEGASKPDKPKKKQSRMQKFMDRAWDLFDDYLTDSSNWDVYKDYWDVRSIGLSKGLSGLIKRQGQIVGIKTGEPPSEVPEPATMVLFGLGLMGLAGVVKRRTGEKK